MFWSVSQCLGGFGNVLLRQYTLWKMGWSGAKLRAMKSCQNFSQQTNRSTPLDPNLMFRCISYYLGAFGTVWLPYETRCKSSCHEVASEFFATNTPNPPHWTLNSCFGAFRTVLVHFGQFGWLTKLGAKRTELEQNVVPRSRVGIFRNKCTRSTPLNYKLMFWCVS